MGDTVERSAYMKGLFGVVAEFGKNRTLSYRARNLVLSRQTQY